MGRMYVAEFANVAVTAQQDFFEVAAPADAIVVIHSWALYQDTEVGDAAEEGLQVLEKRGEGSVTSGLGGSTPTARPLEKGDPAFGGTVEANNTTKMAVGTGAIVGQGAYAWNVRVPLERVYTPEERRVVSPSDRWTLELAKTPTDSITMSGWVIVEEVGG